MLRGRDLALGVLRAALADADRGRGRLVVVSGEAGIGKTALAEVFGREAASEGAAVTHGRAWELSDAPPYFPVWPCLRSIGVDVGAQNPFELWEAVLGALATASQDRSVLWIVDDLHVADLQTLDLLAFLARPVGALRVVIVVTARTGDPRSGERVAARLARVARDGAEVTLGPLSRDDVAALARECAGSALTPAQVDRLFALTGGNPLFVTHCARALDRAELPATVRHAILERIGLLPEDCRRLLTAAAIAGCELTAARVARIDGSTIASTIDALQPAVRAGLIEEVEPGAYRFRHVLVRDTLEHALAASARSALHARAEHAVAAEGDHPELMVERARHALAGAVADDADRVLALTARAATWLEARGAHDRVHAIYARVEQLRRAGVLPAAAPAARLQLARTSRAAGRHAEAMRICDEVAAHARELGDATLLGLAAWQRGAELRPGVVDPGLVGLLHEALAILPASEHALRCRLLARLAAACQPNPDDEWAPVAMAREAIAAARALGDADVLRDVLLFAGGALVDVAPLDERIAVARELLDRSASDPGKALRALSRLAVDRLELGDLSAFDQHVEQMHDRATANGEARHRWRPLMFASMRALMHGQVDRSERLLTEVAELESLTDDPALELSLTAHRLRRARLLHLDDETLAALRAYEGAMQGVPRGELVVAALRLGCLARMQDAAGVATELARLAAQDEAVWARGFHGWLAEAYAIAGTDAQRRRARSHFTPSASRELVVSHVALTYEGPVLRLLGLLDASLGDLASAEDALRRATATAIARGHRPWVAQLRYDLSTILPASRGAEARALRAEAGAIARELGMDGLARRAGGATPTPPSPAGVRLVRDGELWRVEHDGATHLLRDSRGMQLLARLVERPREELHVLALASDDGAALVESSAGEVIDARAREQYRARLAELAVQLVEAEDHADLGRVDRLRGEQELVERELFRSLGLGGQARQARSASERARVNVQRRLKDAIARIAEVVPELGAYLNRAIRTGTYCSFRP